MEKVALTLCLTALLSVTSLAKQAHSGPVAEDNRFSCARGWTRYGSKKCLRYVNDLQDFERAQATCRSSENQGSLVKIHSLDEQNFVFSYIHSIAASSTPIWIGARQMDFESILWLDKTENTYTNWAPSQPSHLDEICITVNPRTGMWHDITCTETNIPACERAPTTQSPFFVAFCPEGWFQYHDEKCVRIISSQALNFYESQELCRSKYNSKLLSIKSDNESLFVHNLIKFKDVKLPIWLGAVQNDFSSFTWIDRSDVTYTNWADGEPNDPDHACLSMTASNSGKWYDNDCKERKLIVCQKSIGEDDACETGWLQFRQTKCYRFVHVKHSFEDADTLCSTLYGGHLPSVHSQEEQYMLNQFLLSVNVKNGSEIWLGGRQQDYQNFNWGDGSQFNFAFWDNGEPGYPTEKCIEMSWRNGHWNDINCRLKRAVLCERPVGQMHPLKPNLYQAAMACLGDLSANCSASVVSSINDINNYNNSFNISDKSINSTKNVTTDSQPVTLFLAGNFSALAQQELKISNNKTTSPKVFHHFDIEPKTAAIKPAASSQQLELVAASVLHSNISQVSLPSNNTLPVVSVVSLLPSLLQPINSTSGSPVSKVMINSTVGVSNIEGNSNKTLGNTTTSSSILTSVRV